jgi:hypothetical protein
MSIQQLGGIIAAAWLPSASVRTGQVSQDGAPAWSASVNGVDTGSMSVSDEALKAALHRARMMEWVENINGAERPSSPLIERPLPDGHRPSYPSAMEAYREVNELIPKL